jgi:hypothetical protein
VFFKLRLGFIKLFSQQLLLSVQFPAIGTRLGMVVEDCSYQAHLFEAKHSAND